MQILPGLPWIFKALGSLGIILLINNLAKNLTLSVTLGALTLAILSGHSFIDIFNIASDCLFSMNNILMMIVIAQVYWLSNQMAKTGVMQDLVSLIQSKLSSRISMAVLPAVIGFLPVPGGSLFSAPLVDNCDPETHLEPPLKSVINYWYRHVWEYWWPLYPGVLLAMDITGLNTPQFLIFGLPLSLTAIITGYIFFLRQVPKDNILLEKKEGSLKRFLLLISPIIIIIGTNTLLQSLFPKIAQYNRYLPISLGIIVATIFLQILRPLDLKIWPQIICEKKIFSLLLQVSTIRVYAAFIEAKLPCGTPLVAKISEELYTFGIPITIMIMLLPFISALTSGLAMGFVGPSFPIVISLLGENPAPSQLYSTLVLAYGFGLMGIMLSPVHVCQTVSNEYFETKLTQSLSLIFKPAIVVMLFSILFHLLFRFLI